MADWFPKQTIGDLPARAAAQWGQREALVFRDQRWTYRQFDAEVERVARALMASGVQAGEHVALLVTARPEFLYLFYAIIRVGAVVFPLNTRYRALDLAYALRQSKCTTLFTVGRAGETDYLALVLDVLGKIEVSGSNEVHSSAYPHLRRVVALDETQVQAVWQWADFLKSERQVQEGAVGTRAAQVNPDNAAIIMYTSGTTGHPKGVMLSHAGIQRCAYRAALMGFTFKDVLLNYLPLFHLYSLGYIVMQSILTGAKQILTETFDAEQSLRLIAEEKVTILHGFDTHYRELMAAKQRNPAVDTSSLRVGNFATGLENVAAVAIATQEQLCPTVAGYGLTETWSGVTQSALDANLDQRTRASGYSLLGVEIRIVNPETGEDMPSGEQGEVYVRSASNMIGYYDDPAATKEAMDADGWLHTGDAGIIREDGHFRFVGRYKDMLKVGGENVSPAEIESLLLQIPGVMQAAIVGYPDPRLQEIPAAFLVLAQGAAIGLADVEEFCRGKIARFKIPRQVVAVTELPMTPSGKVQKHKLRDALK